MRLKNVAGAPVRPATFLILHTDILTYMHTCAHAQFRNKYTIIIASVPTHNLSCTHMHTLIQRYSLFPIGTMNADDDDADADNDYDNDGAGNGHDADDDADAADDDDDGNEDGL